MKKICVVICIMFFLQPLPLVTAKAEAGSLLLGVKAWYETTWDSALLNIFAEIFVDALEIIPDFEDSQYETFIGYGYLAGPLVGYQTDNGRWSFSFAPMVLSTFRQDVHTSALVYNIVEVPVQAEIDTAVDVSRMDFDLAASYSLTHLQDWFFLLKYCKLFAGLKYQQITYDFDNTIRISLLEEYGPDYSFDYQVYMPTVGMGFVYPFTEDIVAGIQGGIGMAHFEDINVDDSLAFNVEANLSISPLEHMIIQLGYRYQQFTYNLHPYGSAASYRSVDKNYGPTLTFIYAL